jgi:hypothetical protein
MWQCDVPPISLKSSVSFARKSAEGMHAFILIWTTSLAIPVHIALEREK